MLKNVGLGIASLAVGFVLWPVASDLWRLLLEGIIWPSAGDGASPVAGTVTWIALCVLLGLASGVAVAVLSQAHSLFYALVISVGAAAYSVAMWLFGVIEVGGIYRWWLHEAAGFIILPPVGALVAARLLANIRLQATR